MNDHHQHANEEECFLSQIKKKKQLRAADKTNAPMADTKCWAQHYIVRCLQVF